MAIAAKENAKTGLIHNASKLLNTEKNFEKTLTKLTESITSELSQCKPFDISNLQKSLNDVTKILNDIIAKRKTFTSLRQSNDPEKLEDARIEAQKAVRDAIGGNAGILNSAIANASNCINDMQRFLSNNTTHLENLSKHLISIRNELTRKNDKDGKAYGNNYASEIKTK